MKILAMQFRYLGDAVLMTPALRAIRKQFPTCELHVLVAREVAPVLEHAPWLTRVWAYPRIRGKGTIIAGGSLIRELRRERFDRSVDFTGNDRGAIISRLCGARQRLGPLWPGGFFGRRFCYTQTTQPRLGWHEARLNLEILSAWEIPIPESLDLEIQTDPARAEEAGRIMPRPAILCHLSASQPKKEWPLDQWAELFRLASSAGHELVFSSGITPRESLLLGQLTKLVPDAQTLPVVPDLATFLAVLKRARLFIGGDTAPLHLAAALGLPTISFYGPTLAQQWAPLGKRHRAVQVENCICTAGNTAVCSSSNACLRTISPEAVLQMISEALSPDPIPPRSI